MYMQYDILLTDCTHEYVVIRYLLDQNLLTNNCHIPRTVPAHIISKGDKCLPLLIITLVTETVQLEIKTWYKKTGGNEYQELKGN